MRVQVDINLCQAHAQCVIIAPEVFALSETQEYAVVMKDPVPNSLHEDVRAATRACPVQAIHITED